MRVGVSGGAINEGTIDQVIAEARRAEADGFDSYWVSTTDFVAAEYAANADEAAATREALKSLL